MGPTPGKSGAGDPAPAPEKRRAGTRLGAAIGLIVLIAVGAAAAAAWGAHLFQR
jgi:hypothetical protein